MTLVVLGMVLFVRVSMVSLPIICALALGIVNVLLTVRALESMIVETPIDDFHANLPVLSAYNLRLSGAGSADGVTV
jgi:hypothetical protein